MNPDQEQPAENTTDTPTVPQTEAPVVQPDIEATPAEATPVVEAAPVVEQTPEVQSAESVAQSEPAPVASDKEPAPVVAPVEEVAPEPTTPEAPKKSSILPLLIVGLVIVAAGAVAMYFLYK